MHLFIMEDGTPFQKDSITEEDKDGIQDGVVTGFKIENGEFYEINPDGTTWEKVETK